MKTIYEKYMASPIDKELLCLEHGEITEPYFCYPVNAEPIGFEGCILYCFLPEYGEMVFACDPESCAECISTGKKFRGFSPFDPGVRHR